MARSRTHVKYRDKFQHIQTLCGLAAYRARDAGENEPSCKLCKAKKLRLAKTRVILEKIRETDRKV